MRYIIIALMLCIQGAFLKPKCSSSPLSSALQGFHSELMPQSHCNLELLDSAAELRLEEFKISFFHQYPEFKVFLDSLSSTELLLFCSVGLIPTVKVKLSSPLNHINISTLHEQYTHRYLYRMLYVLHKALNCTPFKVLRDLTRERKVQNNLALFSRKIPQTKCLDCISAGIFSLLMQGNYELANMWITWLKIPLTRVPLIYQRAIELIWKHGKSKSVCFCTSQLSALEQKMEIRFYPPTFTPLETLIFTLNKLAINIDHSVKYFAFGIGTNTLILLRR